MNHSEAHSAIVAPAGTSGGIQTGGASQPEPSRRHAVHDQK